MSVCVHLCLHESEKEGESYTVNDSNVYVLTPMFDFMTSVHVMQSKTNYIRYLHI